MGHCGEWLHGKRLGGTLRNTSPATLTDALTTGAATENGRFSVKIFPSHIRKTYRILKMDIIRDLSEKHSVSCLVLRRRDRLRQAISLARSKATGEWSASHNRKGNAEYNFDLLCRYYFNLERDNNFWPGYLNLLQIDYETFYYEDMLENHRPCINWMAAKLDVRLPDCLPDTEFTIQRDAKTEEWAERFLQDAKRFPILRHAGGRNPPARSPSNIVRFLTSKPLE